MSNLLIIEDKIINKNKINNINIYNTEKGFYEINNKINLRVVLRDNIIALYFFSKNNELKSVIFNTPLRYEGIWRCVFSEHLPLLINIHVDSTVCSNNCVKDFKDIYKYISYIEKNECKHRNVEWLFDYIKMHSKPILFYGVKIYTDIKSMQEIVLEPKYSSKEETLEFIEKELECRHITY